MKVLPQLLVLLLAAAITLAEVKQSREDTKLNDEKSMEHLMRGVELETLMPMLSKIGAERSLMPLLREIDCDEATYCYGIKRRCRPKKKKSGKWVKRTKWDKCIRTIIKCLTNLKTCHETKLETVDEKVDDTITSLTSFCNLFCQNGTCNNFECVCNQGYEGIFCGRELRCEQVATCRGRCRAFCHEDEFEKDDSENYCADENCKCCYEKCGGMYTSESGIIRHPKRIDTYFDMENCTWEIYSPVPLWISFSSFNTEDCCDKLYIRSGSHSGSLLGEFSGSTLPMTLMTEGDTYIQFTSDHGIQSTGFVLHWYNCGGIYSSESGTIQHPLSGNYDHNQKCLFIIISPIPLLITFSGFETERCCDHLYVRNGHYITSPLLGKFSGYTLPQTLKTDGDAHILFTSDYSIHRTGFTLHWYDCGDIYSSEEGIIQHPLTFGNYENNENCLWIIQSPIPLFINFTDFNTQHCCDHLYVRDGNNIGSSLLGQFEGASLPMPLNTDGDAFILFTSDGSVTRSGFTLHWNDCGGIYSSDSGTIRHPDFRDSDDNYDNNEYCIWIIKSSVPLFISISTFSTETCCDFLYIRNGGNNESPLLGKFSGSTVPMTLETEGDAYILFTTDGSDTYSGFVLDWYNCGGIYNSRSGTLQHPLTITNYDHNENCLWIVYSPVPLLISFSGFRTESCCDHLYIRNGTHSESHLLGKFSGSTLPMNLTTGGGGDAYILFTSDGSVHNTGFTLHWETPCIGHFECTNGKCANLLTVCDGNDDCGDNSDEEEICECGGTYSLGTGRIQHPKIFYKYDHNEDCLWIINSPVPLIITFSGFSTEHCCDHLYVRNGIHNDSDLIGAYSGRTLPTALVTEGGANIRFTSDGSVHRTGFTFHWYNFFPGCGGVYSQGPPRTIQHPLSIGNYSDNEDCHWIIISPVPLLIFFSGFETETCCDHLYIRNGTNSDSDLIGEFSGSTLPMALSTEGSAYIRFTSDGSIRKTGFTLHWETPCIDHFMCNNGVCITHEQLCDRNTDCGDGDISDEETCDCTTIYSQPSGTIQHPINVGNYDPNEDCLWIINSPVPLLITFSGFETERNYDHLYIRNGSQSDSHQIGEFSGSTLPMALSTGGSAYIRFTSDGSFHRTGFTLHWSSSCIGHFECTNGKCITLLTVCDGNDDCGDNSDEEDICECGGVYSEESGTIQHPKLFENYDHNETCRWIINSPVPLLITISDFETEENIDHLYIRNGIYHDSDLIGVFSGSTLPTAFRTEGGANILFTSDGSIHKSGFTLHWYTPCIDNFECTNGACVNITTVCDDNDDCGDNSDEGEICVCGGTFSEASGIIQHPKVFDNYDHNEDCLWIINSPVPLIITFSGFETEQCCDHLAIRNGIHNDSDLIGVFSGSTTMALSTKGSANIRFTSDGSVHNTGFTLHWYNSSVGCGGVYSQGPPRTIQHPLSFGNYSDNEDCHWIINSPVPLLITFTAFKTESSYDYLYIRDGTNVDSEIIGEFSGSTLPMALNTNGSAYIRFTSDGSITNTGFTVDWETPCIGHFECTNGVCITHEQLCNKNDDCGDYSDEETCECGGIYSQASGTIQHPTTIGNYSNDQECLWVIKSSVPLLITFTAYDTEYSWDYLYIRDGLTSDSELVGEFTGTTLPMPLNTRRSAYILFEADSIINAIGFTLHWESIDSSLGCGGVYSQGPPRTIQHPLSFVNYLDNEDCHWIINSPVPLLITFTEFKTEALHDYLYIRNGPSIDSDIIGEFSGSTLPMALNTGGGAYIQFTSDESITNTGFTVHWETPCIGHFNCTNGVCITHEQVCNQYDDCGDYMDEETCECGGVYSEESGTIQHPTTPGNYSNNQECLWIIKSSVPLLITFTAYDTEYSWDYLYIRNGLKSDSELIGEFSGTNVVPMSLNTGGSAYILFEADSIISAKGFTLTWETIAAVRNLRGGGSPDAESVKITKLDGTEHEDLEEEIERLLPIRQKPDSDSDWSDMDSESESDLQDSASEYVPSEQGETSNGGAGVMVNNDEVKVTCYGICRHQCQGNEIERADLANYCSDDAYKCCHADSIVSPNLVWTNVDSDRFVRYSQEMSWADARTLCQDFGLDLYQPRASQAVAIYLESTFSDTWYWIGAHGNGTHQLWLTGEVLTPAEYWYKDYYGLNEGLGTDYCVEIITESGHPSGGTFMAAATCTGRSNINVLCG